MTSYIHFEIYWPLSKYVKWKFSSRAANFWYSFWFVIEVNLKRCQHYRLSRFQKFAIIQQSLKCQTCLLWWNFSCIYDLIWASTQRGFAMLGTRYLLIIICSLTYFVNLKFQLFIFWKEKKDEKSYQPFLQIIFAFISRIFRLSKFLNLHDFMKYFLVKSQ